jgi:multidrug transporter EmrE-like cation transporter
MKTKENKAGMFLPLSVTYQYYSGVPYSHIVPSSIYFFKHQFLRFMSGNLCMLFIISDQLSQSFLKIFRVCVCVCVALWFLRHGLSM